MAMRRDRGRAAAGVESPQGESPACWCGRVTGQSAELPLLRFGPYRSLRSLPGLKRTVLPGRMATSAPVFIAIPDLEDAEAA